RWRGVLSLQECAREDPCSPRPASSRGSLPGLRVALTPAPFLARLGNLGDELADNRLAKRLEILCHHDEGTGAADNIGAIILIDPAGRIGVLRIPRQRRFAQDRKAIDRDALGRGLIAQFGYIAARIVGAVTPNIDGLAARTER